MRKTLLRRELDLQAPICHIGMARRQAALGFPEGEKQTNRPKGAKEINMKSEAFAEILSTLSEAEFNSVIKLVELEIDRRAPKSPEDALVAALKGSEGAPKPSRASNIPQGGIELLDCHIGTKFRIGKSKRLNVLKHFKDGRAFYETSKGEIFDLPVMTKVTVTK